MSRMHASTMSILALSPSRGRSFLLTCVDGFTRWCEATLLVDRHTETVILAFLQNQFTTDLGPQLESTVCVKLCEFRGCETIQTTALMSHASRENWVDNLHIILRGLNSSLKFDVNACAAELVYGSTMRLP